MKKTIAAIAAIAAIAVSVPLIGQEAKIMILERRDTDRLKTAYQEYKRAQSEWDKVKLEVAKKYTTENGKILEGWDKVDYSVDFRAVVPHRDNSLTSFYRPLQYLTGSGTFQAPITTSGNMASTTGDSGITITGKDGTVANIDASNGDLVVNMSPGVRQDLKTKEK